MGKFIGIFERMLLMGIFFGHSVLFSLTAGFFSPGLGGFGFRPSNHCCGGLYRPAQCNCLSLLLFSCLIPTSYRISCPPPCSSPLLPPHRHCRCCRRRRRHRQWLGSSAKYLLNECRREEASTGAPFGANKKESRRK